jgi:hypothetical protein
MLVLAGVIGALAITAGGGEVVARVLVESDAWKVRTKKADLATYADRIVVTTDVDNARVKILNANIELARQTTLPTAGILEGTLGYDSTAHLLKYFNGTGWVSSGSGGGGGGASPGRGYAGGRLFGSGSNLTYAAWFSDVIDVNSEYVKAAQFMTPTTTLIDTAGANTAATMSDGVVYHVYISNSQVTWAPNAMRCSASSGVSTSFGSYLGTTGTAANWRRVGMVRLIGGQFVDDDTRRFIFNLHNKLPKRLYTVPGYADNAQVTTWSAPPPSNWFGLNNGIGSRLEFLTDGVIMPEFHARVTAKISGGDAWFGISDGNQQAQVQAVVQQGVYTNVSLTHHVRGIGVGNYWYCDLQYLLTGGTVTVLVDNSRVHSLVPDSPVTVFYGTVWN